jgi:hypothetical protein
VEPLTIVVVVAIVLVVLLLLWLVVIYNRLVRPATRTRTASPRSTCSSPGGTT